MTSEISSCSVIFKAKLRKAHNWYQSRTLVTEFEWCEKTENVIFDARFFPYLCIMMEPFILMDPYTFDADLPKIWNYAIHPVLSHELGHGFDPITVFYADKGDYDTVPSLKSFLKIKICKAYKMHKPDKLWVKNT